jgi:hypothetical protein
MNRKLELLGLLFLGNNYIYGDRVIKLIRRKVLNNEKSFKSISNYLREKSKIENLENRNE